IKITDTDIVYTEQHELVIFQRGQFWLDRHIYFAYRYDYDFEQLFIYTVPYESNELHLSLNRNKLNHPITIFPSKQTYDLVDILVLHVHAPLSQIQQPVPFWTYKNTTELCIYIRSAFELNRSALDYLRHIFTNSNKIHFLRIRFFTLSRIQPELIDPQLLSILLTEGKNIHTLSIPFSLLYTQVTTSTIDNDKYIAENLVELFRNLNRMIRHLDFFSSSMTTSLLSEEFCQIFSKCQTLKSIKVRTLNDCFRLLELFIKNMKYLKQLDMFLLPSSTTEEEEIFTLDIVKQLEINIVSKYRQNYYILFKPILLSIDLL
ncbi:unnamed protein product, partial [Didymodactylos carnosus]